LTEKNKFGLPNSPADVISCSETNGAVFESRRLCEEESAMIDHMIALDQLA